MNNDKYIEKWLDGSLNEEEQRVFESTQDYHSIKKIDDALLLFKAPEYNVLEELERLQEKKAGEGKVISVSWFPTMVRVAAVVTMVIIGYLLFFDNSAKIIKSGIAQKTELLLPDQSSVTLNASSVLSYVEENWQENRQVKLQGEAYFRVAKGSRFDVETTSGVITVLGTQFNVKIRDNYFEVICYEGLVAVNSELDSIKLLPNSMYRIIDGTAYRKSNLKDTAPSWIMNEGSFTSVPFKEVIREFERQYNVIITTNEVDLDQLFTGRFTHDDISLALKSISLPFNLSYELGEHQRIVLTSDKK
jgi:transmembrane sensor